MSSTNKKIPIWISEKLKALSNDQKVLFYDLWLESDCAGIHPNDKGQSLQPLYGSGLIKATSGKIVLQDYISSNYGKELKPTYNPHKPVLDAIEKAGFSYEIESNSIKIPEKDLISDFESSIKLDHIKDDTNIKKEVAKPEIKENGILENLSSIKFALALAAMLTIAQSFHTGYSLYLISELPNPYNMVFAIGAAILLDALIIYFVATGSIKNSLVFLFFSTLMNIYAFHYSEQIQYFEYHSWFAFVIAFIIPYSIHAVASMVNLENFE